MRHRLAQLLGVPVKSMALEIAGINHPPVILRLDVGGQNGLDMVRDWLAIHDPLLIDPATAAPMLDELLEANAEFGTS